MKTKREQTIAELIAKNMRLDFAALMWRRMLELNMDVNQLAAKAKIPVKAVDDMLHAKGNMFQIIGKIGAALDVQVTIVRTK